MTTPLHNIFGECCGNSVTFNTEDPFHSGKYIYATDQRIIVRTEAAGRCVAPEPPGLPPVDSLGWPLVPLVPTLELPAVGNGNMVCDVCGGKRIIDGFCCQECDGEGFYPDPTGVLVGELKLAKKYIALLRRNGITGVAPIGMPSVRKRGKMVPGVYFKGDGFEGILAGMKV